MKNVKMAAFSAAMALFSAQMISAGGFDNQTAVLTAKSGNLQFSTSVDKNDVKTATAQANFGRFALGAWNFESDAAFGYTLGSDRVSLTVETNGSHALSTSLDMTAGLGVTYAQNLSGPKADTLVATPTIGLSYDFNDRINAFTKVSYSLDANDGLNPVGGLAEVGGSFSVSDSLAFKATVGHSFDTANDGNTLKAETVFSF